MPMDLIGQWERDEIVGDDEIEGLAVGDDVDALLAMTGAAPSGANIAAVQKMLAARRQAALARHFNPRVVATATRRADRQREYPLGFDSVVDVPAGAVVTIAARPQVVFRGERLIVPSNIAPSFLIQNIVVGKDSQQVAPGAVPAIAFSEVGVGVRLKLDTSQPGIDISLVVQNVSAVPVRFSAALIGTVVE
jgi:hypothetical protein